MAAAKKLSHDNRGMPVYETADGKQWSVGSKSQADKAARNYILDSLWAFNTDFIARAAGLTDEEAKGVRTMQEKLSEEANPIIRRIIGERNLERFVREAINADGRGHFLSPYDSEERESDEIEGLPRGKLAYRVD